MLFHTDAVQAAGHVPIDVNAHEHRHAEPLRAQVPRAEGRGRAVRPPRHHRSRTSSRAARRSAASAAARKTSPASSAMAAALEEACANMDENTTQGHRPAGQAHRRHCQDPALRAERRSRSPRLPGNVNFCFEGIEGESLLLLLDAKGICASSGSRLHLRLARPQPRAAGHRPAARGRARLAAPDHLRGQHRRRDRLYSG